MIEYYNGNSMRAYPVYENATQRAADGTSLPQDMLVDLMVTVPAPLAALLYIASVTVTPALVSIAVASSISGGVFAGTYMQPVIPYVPYALTPIVGMASGHVVFGPAVARTADLFQFISDTISQSGLDTRAVHPIDPGVVLSLGRYNSPDSHALKGVVRLEIGRNMTIRYDAGMIKIGLISSAAGAFVNPCDQEAMYDNCGGNPPIRTINKVGPDSNGKITLKVNNG